MSVFCGIQLCPSCWQNQFTEKETGQTAAMAEGGGVGKGNGE